MLTAASDIYVSYPTQTGSISDEIRPRPRFLANLTRYLPFLTPDDRYKPLVPLLHRFRSVKSGAEVACMREAGRISGGAFNEVIRRGLRREGDIEATLEWLFRMGGCEKSAYVPVVAGGSVLTPASPDFRKTISFYVRVFCVVCCVVLGRCGDSGNGRMR